MAVNIVTPSPYNPFPNEIKVSPLITDLVLGTPILPGGRFRFFKEVNVPAPVVTFREYDRSHLVHVETQRASSAEYAHRTLKSRLKTISLRRDSFEGRADLDDLKMAGVQGGDPLYGSRKINDGRIAIELAKEIRAKDLLTTTGNYSAGHYVTLASGSEWNAAGGDSRANIATAATVLRNSTGIGRRGLTVGLSETSLEAALNDPVFLATRALARADKYPTEGDLIAYWGVKDVFSFNPISSATSDYDATLSPIWGDMAIVFADTLNPANFDVTAGQQVFGATFKYTSGIASAPYLRKEISSWIWPWDEWSGFELIYPDAGYLILNTSE